MGSFDREADDFITTISDGEELPDGESDSSLSPPVPTLKRKRNSRPSDSELKQSKRKVKRSLNEKFKPPKPNGHIQWPDDATSPAEASGSESETGRLPQAQNDGAMDSDFEFNVGDVDFGNLEDIDGWDLEPSLSSRPDADSSAARTRKPKAVNIDDLVAARRASKASKDKNDQSKRLEDSYQDTASDSDATSDMYADVGDEDEDELLAPDAFGMGASLEEEGSEHDDGSQDHEESEEESAASPVPHPDDARPLSIDEEDDPEERAREEAFFVPEPQKADSETPGNSRSFHTMSLSRPILRGLATLNFSEPTPIQAKTIPVALLGKDVVGGAVTGSGKTAAFMIPILERLLYRPRKVPTTRVVILMPTRELAVQCHNVARKLASHTDITFALIVGGFSLREQENVLRRRPDVVIATPGRFIDHMRNSAAFSTDAVEILVLDEADRMLEDGFADELNEILTTIPRSRQTMLFSATMTSRVDQLIRVGLQRPVRLLVDAQRQTVGSLVQEFVRLRPGREGKRLAYLMQLVNTVYVSGCIIFFRQKRHAHRVRILFSLCDIKAAELHGSMSQDQRLAAVEAFRSGAATHLLATDVASRGLDIRGVDVVLNYEAPQTHAIYLHRVGRTARMGRQGRACTIAAEEDRKVVREVVKAAKSQAAKIVSRNVDAAAADAWAERLEVLEVEIEAILDAEKEARAMAQAEMQIRKGENLLEHAEEIASRPKRTWFATESQKAAAKRVGRVELNGPEDGDNQKKLVIMGKKASNKDRKRANAQRERTDGTRRLYKKGKEHRGARKRVNGAGAQGRTSTRKAGVSKASR